MLKTILILIFVLGFVSCVDIKENMINTELKESKQSKLDDVVKTKLDVSFPGKEGSASASENRIKGRKNAILKDTPDSSNVNNSSVHMEKHNSNNESITEIQFTTAETKNLKLSDVPTTENKEVNKAKLLISSNIISKSSNISNSSDSNTSKNINISTTTLKPIHLSREGVFKNPPEKNIPKNITDKTDDNTSSKLKHKNLSSTTDHINITNTSTSVVKSSTKVSKVENPSTAGNITENVAFNSSSAAKNSVTTPTTITVRKTTTTTTTTSTTSTTTTTTTTPKPKKPKITYSPEDMPSILKVIPDKSPRKPTGKLDVEEPEQPIAQPSQELNSYYPGGHRDIIIPIVGLIFAVPVVMGAFIILYRKVKDYWSTRHYRRMDFLVDGMYND